MSKGDIRRTEQDLQRTVRALAREFKTDKVFIIGSQAILLSWPDAPPIMRASPEIDAYPANARIWEIEEKKRDPRLAGEASEHIHALFGEGSQFHDTHGFFIDGVDENTAKLPADWQTRAIVKRFDVDEDLIVSKLARLDPKDKDFIEAFHAEWPLDRVLIEARIADSDFGSEAAKLAVAYVRALTKRRANDGERS